MAKNQSDLKEYYQPFLKRIKKIVRENTGVKEDWKAFILWYMEARYLEEEGHSHWVTDGHHDGIIDAVVGLKGGDYVVIQSKYNDNYAKLPYSLRNVRIIPSPNWEPYDTTVIPAFKSEKSWKKYLETQRIPENKIKIYQPVFDAYQENPAKVKFEFITTYSQPSQMQKQFSHLKIANFKDINDIIFLFDEDEDNKTPLADDLELRVTGDGSAKDKFVSYDATLGATSYIARCYVKDLIVYMKEKINPTAIISKNVRVGLHSDINKDLLNSHKDEPENFWYYHNGITILANKITVPDPKPIPGTQQIEEWLTLSSPNIINGAQTMMTLQNASKVDDQATILVKIYQLPLDEKKKKMTNNIIMNTNRQNPILHQDLRANEKVMYEIKQYFGDRGVFYERRRGEKNLLGAQIKNHRQGHLTPPKLGQMILISKNGSKGVMKSKATIELMFKETDNFKKIFENTTRQDMYTMYVVHRLIVDEILNGLPDTQRTGIKYLAASIKGIFWQAISKMTPATSKKFQELLNREPSRLSYKNYNEDLKDLKTITTHIMKMADITRKDMGDPTGKGDKKWAFFVATGGTGDDANQKLFDICKTDTGHTRKKRRKLSGSKKSEGVYKDIQNILKNHVARFNPCSNCSKITDFNEEKCEYCDKEL